MQTHTLFDEKVIASRRKRAAATLSEIDALVLIAAGNPIGIPGGQDQTYEFIPQPEYYWLSGSRRWGGVLAFERDQGWTHFVRPVSATERLWEGDAQAPDGLDVESLPEWLAQHGQRPIALIGQLAHPVTADAALTDQALEHLDATRRVKDQTELILLTHAVRATLAGHARARECIRPGATERYVQIEMEAEMFRQGATSVGYGSIVGTGTRSAILHSTPGAHVIGETDLVLVDAGAAVDGYTADVTRTFPAGGSFTARQQAIYDIVLQAEHDAIGRCHVGTEWHDVHRTAATVIAQGLIDLRVLRGQLDTVLESGAVALFFPHGVGHMVGLGVRDVGGRAAGRPDGRVSCGARVRVDLPLASGFLMTVEPGIYFVDALLGDGERRQQFSDQVNWEVVDGWMDLGGVRIEDNILVTPSGPRNLTAEIPK